MSYDLEEMFNHWNSHTGSSNLWNLMLLASCSRSTLSGNKGEVQFDWPEHVLACLEYKLRSPFYTGLSWMMSSFLELSLMQNKYSFLQIYYTINLSWTCSWVSSEDNPIFSRRRHSFLSPLYCIQQGPSSDLQSKGLLHRRSLQATIPHLLFSDVITNFNPSFSCLVFCLALPLPCSHRPNFSGFLCSPSAIIQLPPLGQCSIYYLLKWEDLPFKLFLLPLFLFCCTIPLLYSPLYSWVLIPL